MWLLSGDPMVDDRRFRSFFERSQRVAYFFGGRRVNR
jgi:hypothetical protein